jgi:glycosyltransferase involved in cell wall biosynthesis
MHKINVLQVSEGLGLGGIEKVLQVYTEHLSKEIFDVSVCGLYNGGVREKILRDKGFDVYILNRNINALTKILQRKKIDIIHIHQHGDLNKFAVRVAREARVKVVVETNVFGRIGEAAPKDLPDMNFLVSKMCALRYKLWMKLPWTEFFKKSDVLYNPIVLSDFNEIDDFAKRELRKKYHISDDCFIIGRHGRPDPIKWGDMCIDMMPHLLRMIQNVKYLALGFPAEKIKKIKAMGLESSFIFLDPTEDVNKINEFLWLLDVFPYSSVNGESFGLAIAEAMTCKRPVVANSTPCRDNAQVELIDHGSNGFIANNPRAFAEAVGFLLKNEKKRFELGEAARRKVEVNYEVKRNTLRLEKNYLDLLCEKGAQIDPMVREKYENIKTYPSREEIANFENEYKNRIRNSYGGKNYLQIYFWEFILRDFKKYNKLKSIKQFFESTRER